MGKKAESYRLLRSFPNALKPFNTDQTTEILQFALRPQGAAAFF